ncbi:hypothetical protein Tco_1190068, partial [Tanacetum coccineum]
VDGKFISDKDFGAKVDTQSSSSRNVDDGVTPPDEAWTEYMSEGMTSS